MQVERIGSHFSHNGQINFVSRPDCYICKDASVDTHIDVRHLSLLTSDIWHNLQSHQYGCLQKRLCKCSNLVEKWKWLDHYVRNESPQPICSACIFSFVYFWDCLHKMKTRSTQAKSWARILNFFLFCSYDIDTTFPKFYLILVDFSIFRDTLLTMDNVWPDGAWPQLTS